MKYVVRLNPKAFNPITQKVDYKRVWEIEQCATKDSEKVIWHGADVKINGNPIRNYFTVPKPGEKPWSFECYGICLRGLDEALELRTGPCDASGN